MIKIATSSSFSFREQAREQLVPLLTLLRAQPADVNAAVHDARRELKKLRALLRLCRHHLGEERYRVEDSSLRDAGRLLSPLRDAWVRLTLTENLGRELDGSAVTRVLGIAADSLRESFEQTVQAHPPELLFRAATDILAPALDRLQDWPDPGGEPFAACSKGLRSTYRRAREGLLESLSNPTMASLHEWRKRCKDLRYHLELLESPERKPFRGVISSLRKLTGALGTNHDLAVLRETVSSQVSRSLNHRQLLALHQTLEPRQRASMDQAFALGFRIFSSKPKPFTARLEKMWEKGRRAS